MSKTQPAICDCSDREPQKAALQLTLFLLVLNIGIALLVTHPYRELARLDYSSSAANRFVYLDTYTESLAEETAENYRRHGLLHHAGLPEVSDEWIKNGFPNTAASSGVDHLYLHYPSVPYLLAGVGAILFGTDKTLDLRAIPLMINAVLLFLFLNGIFSVLEGSRRKIFVICFAAIPMGWAQMYGFANVNYGHYVLLALIGVMLPLLRDIQPRLSSRHYVAAAVFGFLQGCFTFEYLFVMAAVPVAIACLYHGGAVFKERRLCKTVLWLSADIAVGFCVAQFVHLLQIAVYYGSLLSALKEMWSVCQMRVGGDGSNYHFLTGLSYEKCADCYSTYIAGLGPIVGRLKLLFDYLLSYTAYDSIGRPILIAPIGFYVLFAGTIICERGNDAAKGRFFKTAGISVTACLLWPVIMPNHGADHPFLIAQHFFMAYLMLVLIMIETFVPLRSTAPSPGSHSSQARP